MNINHIIIIAIDTNSTHTDRQHKEFIYILGAKSETHTKRETKYNYHYFEFCGKRFANKTFNTFMRSDLQSNLVIYSKYENFQ